MTISWPILWASLSAQAASEDGIAAFFIFKSLNGGVEVAQGVQGKYAVVQRQGPASLRDNIRFFQ